MATALLSPPNVGMSTPLFGSYQLGTSATAPSSMGTSLFGPAQTGTPVFGPNQTGTPIFGTAHAGTPIFGHSHLVTPPGGARTVSAGGGCGVGTPTFCGSHGSPSLQHVVTPVICSYPSYRGPVLHSLVGNKPRSPQESSSSGPLPDSPEEPDEWSTPYRLPRLAPRATPCPPYPDDRPPPPDSADTKVWGRFGFEDHVRMPELGPSIHKALTMSSNSPLTHPLPSTPGGSRGTGGGVAAPPGVSSRTVAAAQRYRQSAKLVPKFRNAAIIPSVTTITMPPMGKDAAEDSSEIKLYRSLVGTGDARGCGGWGGGGGGVDRGAEDWTASPGSRSVSSAAKSIHWALGNHTHPLFDYKGRGRKQGPYSREFTVHCMPPASWMKMKWGRQRVTAH
ncbi:hypothetical protein ACOMHN_058436 [Nucella lapillus]